MAKNKTTKSSRIEKFIAMFTKDEFCKHPTEELYCNLCGMIVSSDRKSSVDSHRMAQKHVLGLSKLKTSNQTFLTVENSEFTKKLISAFLSSDIPLSKLNNTEMKELFDLMGFKLPSESTARAYLLNNLTKSSFLTLKSYFKKKKIFIFVDESEICGVKYVNLLAGLIENPHVNYVIDVYALPSNVSLDSDLVKNIIELNFLKYEIDFSNLKLVVTDAARYMMRAFKEIKLKWPNFFHITCLAHLIHNCAMKVKAHYETVDRCISTVKAITVKNRNISSIFSIISKPPGVIVTRWSSWLRATLYYSKNFPVVKNIVNSLQDEGVLIKKAKEAVNDPNIVKDLIEVVECYSSLIIILDKFENSEFNIETGFAAVNELKFTKDPVELKIYFTKRLYENEISKLLNFDNDNISPETYLYLKNCIPTSIPVERSFSMLKKMLQYDRNFNTENIYSYFAPYYNRKEE